MAKAMLRKTRETRVRGGHPWIYASEIETVEGECAPGGVIVLEMFGDEAQCVALKEKLAAIEGLDVQEMVFGH